MLLFFRRFKGYIFSLYVLYNAILLWTISAWIFGCCRSLVMFSVNEWNKLHFQVVLLISTAVELPQMASQFLLVVVKPWFFNWSMVIAFYSVSQCFLHNHSERRKCEGFSLIFPRFYCSTQPKYVLEHCSIVRDWRTQSPCDGRLTIVKHFDVDKLFSNQCAQCAKSIVSNIECVEESNRMNTLVMGPSMRFWCSRSLFIWHSTPGATWIEGNRRAFTLQINFIIIAVQQRQRLPSLIFIFHLIDIFTFFVLSPLNGWRAAMITGKRDFIHCIIVRIRLISEQ